MIRTKSPKSQRGRYYARYLAHYTKKNHLVFLLGGLFLAGVVLGTFLVRSAKGETLELLLRLIGDFSGRRRELPFMENFLSGLWNSLAVLTLTGFCGFCALGQPVIVCIPFLRGLGFGFSAASLYAAHGAGAAGFIGVFLLPGMVVSTLALLFCGAQALRLSGNLWRLLRGAEKEPYSLRDYVVKLLGGGMICAFAAFLEAVFYMLFSAHFVLA